MTELMRASHEWATRKDDERFLSLPDMQEHFDTVQANSRGVIVPSRRITVEPVEGDHKGLVVTGPNGHGYTPTNWSFGQLATISESPAGYLRSLPAPIAADCINYGLQFKRDIEDVGVLLQRPSGDEPGTLRAVTGPRYGRVWNADVIRALINRFGDGRTGEFKVPGEFGKAVEITKGNTTLYASDRDFFVFLADEDHRIEIPNRRNGQPGTLSRGFFVWNSEVGSATLGIATFLFDYVCCNRIVWGAEDVKEIKIRHTISAPDRFMAEVAPALKHYAEGSASTITKAIEDARSARFDEDGELDKFLAKRFTKTMATSLKRVHEIEEGRPIENLWDVTVALTAKARAIPFQDDRVTLERQAGEIMALAA